MTREEAIARIKEHKIVHNMNEPRAIYISEALDMAIKALEQETCEDAIRRQDVLDQTYLWSKDEFLRITNPFDYLRKRINDLPSVNPQEPKTGHWIRITSGSLIDKYVCSECKKEPCIKKIRNTWGWDFTSYCPNCGCRMVEPQERSDKE